MRGIKPRCVVVRNGPEIRAPNTRLFLTTMDEIFFERQYTPPWLAIDSDDVVVDIGANIGMFTLFASTQTNSRIYAFEPFPDTYHYLRENLSINKLESVETFQQAVGKECGIARFLITDFDQANRLNTADDGDTAGSCIDVEVVTLASILQSCGGEIDFLKLDCEGAEGEILQSADSTTLDRIRKIAIEYHDQWSVLKHEEITALLEEKGFVCESCQHGNEHQGFIWASRRTSS